MSHMTDTILPREAARRDLHGRTCSAGAPFARLSIGPKSYEIAHALTEEPLLAFRASGQHTWTTLDRQPGESWVKISADILLIDPDVIFDFLQTHAVRTNSQRTPVHEMRFDTLGTIWYARLMEGGRGEVRFEGEDWHTVALGHPELQDGRERAILTLLAAVPDARSRFEPHVTEWAQRIAMGVKIQPVM